MARYIQIIHDGILEEVFESVTAVKSPKFCNLGTPI